MYSLGAMMVLLLAALIAVPAIAANPDLSALPPKVLYHFGQKKNLLENERTGISDEVWEKHIMGRDTRYGLVPYRRGLYGGKNFESLEMFGNSYLAAHNTGKIPWMMKITLKSECLNSENVTDLATDPAYLRALFHNAAYLAQNASVCLNLKTSDCRDLIVGMQPVSFGREENLCDEVMQKLVLESKAKIVRDTEWASSWYLRDRSCIEKIEAGAEVILETFASGDWTMASREDTQTGYGYGLSTFLILLDVLGEIERPNSAVLATLQEKLAASDLRFAKKPVSGPKGYGELPWIREAGPAALEARARCGESGRMQEFKELATQFQRQVRTETAASRMEGAREANLEKAALFFGAAMQAACR